jgi:transcription elongation factor Elf1
MYKACVRCGAEMDVKPSHYDKVFYCSKACMAEAYKDRMTGENNPNFKNAGRHICETCGVEFRSYNKTRRFCSQSCAGRSPQMLERLTGMARVPRKPRRKVGREITCSVCGQVFYSENKVAKCAKCAAIKAGMRKCVICGRSFQSYKPKKTCSKKCYSKFRTQMQEGAKSHLWRGGKTAKTRIIRNSDLYATWRDKVFKRDNYTCQICGERGGKLACHHIKKFSDRPDVVFMIANGITLCWSCHGKVNHHETDYQAQFFAITGGVL